MKMSLLTSPFDCKSNSFSYDGFYAWTRFKTEAEGTELGNDQERLEMAYKKQVHV